MDFKDVVTGRRAINFFDTKKEVSEDLLRKIVDLASKTPSSFNLQPWSMIILKKQDEKMRLRKLAWDQPKVSEAPVVLILLADRNGWQMGHPFVEKNFREMVNSGSMKQEQREWFSDACRGLYGETPEKQQAFACKNTAFFAMSLMYAAKYFGLETHPMDGFDHEAVREAFNVPGNYWIPLLIALGYFDKTKSLHPPKWRKGFDEIAVRFDP